MQLCLCVASTVSSVRTVTDMIVNHMAMKAKESPSMVSCVVPAVTLEVNYEPDESNEGESHEA